jgi:signal transduction histidine kinase
MSPLGRYVRAHLHRRLFVWFGLSIGLTALVMGALTVVLGLRDPAWRDWQRLPRLAANQLARSWEEPQARDALARDIAEQLNLSLRLEDAQGHALVAYGPKCRGHERSWPIERGGELLGRVHACTDRYRHRGNGVLLLLVAAGVLWAASGKIARHLTRPLDELAQVAADIGAGNLSRRIRLSRHAPGEIGKLADAVNDMAARIEKQLSDQRELLAAVSHELRTPLGRIRLLTELARSGDGSAHALDELDREVVEMDALVGDLLASSRMSFSAQDATELDAADLAKRALERAGLDAALLEVATANPRFLGDPTLLGRALANLLDNAAKHGGGARALRVRDLDGRLAFEVDDAGPGLRPGEERRIFEPFYRRARAPEESQGSLGLGLSLVQRIAVAHGGDAYASNRSSEGAAPLSREPAGGAAGPGARVGFTVSRNLPR